jgi:Ca2+-binding EF-hand superfamily protein
LSSRHFAIDGQAEKTEPRNNNCKEKGNIGCLVDDRNRQSKRPIFKKANRYLCNQYLNMTEENEISPLFQNDDDDQNEMTAELFRDRVRSLHEHFDKDEDGHLNFEELAALQKATEGVILSEEMYVMVCRTLDCKPNKGISIDALRLTYASEGADISKFH